MIAIVLICLVLFKPEIFKGGDSKSTTVEHVDEDEDFPYDEDEDEETTSKETTTETTTTQPSAPDGIVPPDVKEDKGSYKVNTTQGLILRTGPGKDYGRVVQNSMKAGTSLSCVGTSNTADGWAYVYVPSIDKYGWVATAYIVEASKYTAPASSGGSSSSSGSTLVKPDVTVDGGYYYVSPSAGLVLRKGPGKGYNRVLSKALPQDTAVYYSGYSSSVYGWAYVYVPSKGVYGWVSTDYLY